MLGLNHRQGLALWAYHICHRNIWMWILTRFSSNVYFIMLLLFTLCPVFWNKKKSAPIVTILSAVEIRWSPGRYSGTAECKVNVYVSAALLLAHNVSSKSRKVVWDISRGIQCRHVCTVWRCSEWNVHTLWLFDYYVHNQRMKKSLSNFKCTLNVAHKKRAESVPSLTYMSDIQCVMNV